MRIKNFNTFLNDQYEYKYDHFVHQYVMGTVSESQFYDYLFSTNTNEGLMDTVMAFGQDFSAALNVIVNKVLNAFFTFLVDASKTGAAKVGLSILSKVVAGATKVMKWIKMFYNKHTVLCKSIVVFITIVIIYCLSATGVDASPMAPAVDVVNAAAPAVSDVVNAANDIKVPTADEINMLRAAMAWLENARPMNGNLDTFKATTYLADLIDGKFDNKTGLSTEYIVKLGDDAIKSVYELKEKAIGGKEENAMRFILELLNKGKDICPVEKMN